MEEKKEPVHIIDIDDYLLKASSEKMDNKMPTEEDLAKYEEEFAKSLGLSIEEYRKLKELKEYRSKIMAKNEDDKMQSFLKTGNPVSILIDENTGEVVGETYRTYGGKK